MPSLLAAWRRHDAARDRAHLYRAWRVGAVAGFTVPAALEAVGELPGDSEAARRWLLAGTRRRAGLRDVVTASGAPLSNVERALLEHGDESGRLEEALGTLADHFTREHRLLLVVRKRMAYPLLTALLATLIAPLPLIAAGRPALYTLVAGLGLAGWLLLGGGLIAALAARCARDPAFVRARFARALASAVGAGVPLPRALHLAAEVSGHPPLRQHIARIPAHRLATQSMADTLREAPMLTHELLAAVAVAERTGDVHTTLRGLAELYENGFR